MRSASNASSASLSRQAAAAAASKLVLTITHERTKRQPDGLSGGGGPFVRKNARNPERHADRNSITKKSYRNLGAKNSHQTHTEKPASNTSFRCACGETPALGIILPDAQPKGVEEGTSGSICNPRPQNSSLDLWPCAQTSWHLTFSYCAVIQRDFSVREM